MSAIAGHPAKLYVKSDSGSYSSSDEIAGIDNVDFKVSGESVDVTTFKDTSGAKLKLMTLADGSASLSGSAEFADAPQTLFRSYGPGGTYFGSSLWLSVEFNPSGSSGSRGFKVECKVESYGVKASVAGRVEFDVSLAFTGAVTAI